MLNPKLHVEIQRVFYSNRTFKLVSKSWAVKRPELVIEVIFAGPVAAPTTYLKALEAQQAQFDSPTFPKDQPFELHHYSCRTGRRAKPKSAPCVNCRAVPLPKSAGAPTTLLKAYTLLLNYEAWSATQKIARKLPNKPGKGGKIANVPNAEFLHLARPAEKPKGGMEELLKRAASKTSPKKTKKTDFSGSGSSMDTFVPRGTTLLGSMD